MRLNYLLPELVNTYKSLKEYFSLSSVMQFLGQLREHYQVIEDECVRPLFLHFYNEFITFAEAYGAGTVQPCEILVKKFIFILDHKSFCKIPNENQLDTLNIFIHRMCHEGKFDETGPDYACILRVMTNIFKVFWIKFSENDVANLNTRNASLTILQFINKLFKCATENDNMNLFLATMVRRACNFCIFSSMEINPRLHTLMLNW